jgi:hypothetical protein
MVLYYLLWIDGEDRIVFYIFIYNNHYNNNNNHNI